jgi:TonB family protein
MSPLPQRPVRRRSRITLALAISVAIHLLLLPFVAKDAVFHVPPQHGRTAVGVVAIPNSQVQHAQRGLPSSTPSSGRSQPDLAPKLPPALEPPKPQPPEKVAGQIVSLGQPQDERPPETATKYLSEHDSRVAKETRARDTDAFFKNPLSKRQKEGKNERAEAKNAPAAPLPGTAGQNGGASASAPKVASELPNRERRDRVHLQKAPDGTVQNRDTSDAIGGNGRKLALAPPGGENTPSGPLGIPGLAPGSPGKRGPLNLTLDRPGESLGPVAGGPMSDDLRGIEEGDETLLNSRSFRYAGFLNRVKETVARIWVQEVQDEAQRHDPNGQIYSYKDRRTVVEFSLDKMGEIRDVRLSVSCGVDYLDRTALDAFKRAERFPNPPPGLIGDQGVVTLPFAFTLLAATGGVKLQIGPAYLPGSPAARGF